MANYATLKQAVQSVIKTNGNEEITGAVLQQSLLAMINSLGANYEFAGVATPDTAPGTPDQNVFYIASEPGTYSNFGGIIVNDGDVCVLKYNGTWVKETTNIAAKGSIDSAVIKPFVTTINTKLDYVKELYIPNQSKTVTKITVRKAYATAGTSPTQYRSRVDVDFSDGTTAYYQESGILDPTQAAQLLETIITDANHSFYLILADKTPSNELINIDMPGTFNAYATHLLINSPTIKEYLDKATIDAHLSQLDTSVSENTENINDIAADIYTIVNFSPVWVDNKLLRNNGGITNIDSSAPAYYNKCATTNPVDCAALTGKRLTLSHVGTTYFAFYRANDTMIGSVYYSYSGTGSEILTIPAEASFFRIGVHVSNANDLASAKTNTTASVKAIKESTTTRSEQYSAQRMGAMKYALPTDFDYSQLLFFGQSFAQGGSSKTGTTGIIPNCYMFGSDVKATTGTAFNPLQQETYEYPVVSCANALSQMYRRYGHNINIVASTAGTGGVSIVTLLNSYVVNVVNMQTNMKAVADAENKTVGCFGIVYMQGETDYRAGNVNDKATYKSYLMQVKNALQQSAMNNLGQTRKPLFFLYQTSGKNWINNDGTVNNEALGPSMAQIEFANENDDVILISPAYQVTTYQDGHPSTNGERWLGEYYAKAIWQTLYRGFRYKNPVPMNFKIDQNKLIIYVSNCVLPLVKNTWTLPLQPNLGFVVKADNQTVTITDVDLVDNAIIITCESNLESASVVKVTYGGVGLGRGNVCDSDKWATWLQYLSDANDTGYDGIRVITQSPTTESGGSLVGKDYPMNNFLCIFYKEITR